MNKLTFVLLFALSSLRAVFAVPQPVAEKIDELGKRGDHIQFGQATIFYPYATAACDIGELYSVTISSESHNIGPLPCLGIPVSVSHGNKTVSAWITNYCDYACAGDNIEINTQLFQELADPSLGYIPVIWAYSDQDSD